VLLVAWALTGCGNPCPGNLKLCGGVCVDLARDDGNCGRCGSACDVASGEHCVMGLEEPLCTSRIPCGGMLLNLQTDPGNCGACGAACAPGLSCIGGTCGCPAAYARCDDRCIWTRTDPNNCGSCGNRCEMCDFRCNAGDVCRDGACQPHCSCVSPKVCCKGINTRCVDLTSDSENCGECGLACDAAGGFTCKPTGTPAVGTCVCAAKLTMPCGVPARCIDTSSDVMNCGDCGRTCPPGVSCVNGACSP